MKKRAFLIVLDSLGAGEAPDADDFGDRGAHTLKSLYETKILRIDTLRRLGLSSIDGLDFLEKNDKPIASFARLCEKSRGKDTVVGHWEIAGYVSKYPFPTFPNGFPDFVLEKINKISGRKILCNKPYSGTKVIEDYGKRSRDEKALIVYTSADSVLQIAAHTDDVLLGELYRICAELRGELVGGDVGVGRIIARPFATDSDGGFVRTADRRDFSLLPPPNLLPERVKSSGLESISIGKIKDIFANVGFTKSYITHSNADGMACLDECADKDFCGLCFANLVDFDMLWGHRRDAIAYANGLNQFDLWLSEFIKKLNRDDVLIITADHGCDPSFNKTTDHTREYVPYIEFSPSEPSKNYGTVDGFGFVTERIISALGI